MNHMRWLYPLYVCFQNILPKKLKIKQLLIFSGKVDHKELDKLIYNRERLNVQIQEAREAIQNQLRSMTSSVPVLLVTYMRSGSSWLGDITQQAKDSIYFYEPFQFMIEEGYYTNGLVCYYNDKCRWVYIDIRKLPPLKINYLETYIDYFPSLSSGIWAPLHFDCLFFYEEKHLLWFLVCFTFQKWI